MMPDDENKIVDCCCLPDATTQGACPRCGSKGKMVPVITVRALLAISLTNVQDTSYLFCREANCPVVYFSLDNTQVFTISEVRERVFQKETAADDVWVCYCFRHTRGSIQLELVNTGQSTVVDTINAGIQAEQCACEIRNPQGSCCLGNVRVVVEQVKESMSTA